jgi:hypothetical protein
MPKTPRDNVLFIANDNDCIFPPRKDAKGGRQRVEGSFADLLERAGIKDSSNFRDSYARHSR